MGTVHGFADTVRFRGRGLIVDRAITTGHDRMIRERCRDAFHVLFCARMQTCSPHFFNLILACQFAHEMRKLSGTPKDLCAAKSLHIRSRQQYFMAASKRRAVRGLG